jgi:hypothetical protein
VSPGRLVVILGAGTFDPVSDIPNIRYCVGRSFSVADLMTVLGFADSSEPDLPLPSTVLRIGLDHLSLASHLLFLL